MVSETCRKSAAARREAIRVHEGATLPDLWLKMSFSPRVFFFFCVTFTLNAIKYVGRRWGRGSDIEMETWIIAAHERLENRNPMLCLIDVA